MLEGIKNLALCRKGIGVYGRDIGLTGLRSNYFLTCELSRLPCELSGFEAHPIGSVFSYGYIHVHHFQSSIEIIQHIRTSTGSFYLRSDGIIESRPDESFRGRFELKEAKESTSAMKVLCGDTPKPLLAVMEDHEISSEARKYFSEHIYVSKVALIGSSSIARFMANLFIRFVNVPIPLKLFSDEVTALQWIEKK